MAAWLLTGDRKKKAKELIGRQAKALKDVLGKRTAKSTDDSETHYI